MLNSVTGNIVNAFVKTPKFKGKLKAMQYKFGNWQPLWWDYKAA